MPWLVTAMGLVAWVPLAAKAHGRQVRLEREAKGIFAVEFGGTNPPEVEALWRRDRLVFWTTMVVLSVLLTASASFAGDWVEAAFAVPVAFAGSFCVAGLSSWVRLGRPDWGSFGWWLAVAAAAALTVASVV